MLSYGIGSSTVTRSGWRPCSTKPRLGSASDVPWITIGSSGRCARRASSKAPGLKARVTPVGERVPSGNIITEFPSASVRSHSPSMRTTLSRSPRFSLM
jgi:hypothetical protein